jgi:nitrate reductase gamma subunit
MTLLEFASGPALTIALTVFVAGTLWRILRLAIRPAPRDLSAPRGSAASGALHGIVRRFWPHPRFGARIGFSTAIGYVYHLGLAVIVFTFLPHIAFVKQLTGLHWPALPDPVTYFAGALTTAALVIALVQRRGDPVKRMLSRFDDYFSWVVTFLPVITGMAIIDIERGSNSPLIAVHLLSFELLLVWFPFGKLMHAGLAFWSRGITGAKYARRGALP